MTVALVLDFPEATRAQYDEAVEGMQLGGRMAAGGLVHVAGTHAGGWRVIDVWDDMENFVRFREEQIVPHTAAAGMAPPRVKLIEVDEQKPGSGERPALVQCVTLPGLDRGSFHAADAQILIEGEPPDELTFHVNGPVPGGWCVIDGWTSREARDQFLQSRIMPAMQSAPLQGPPQIEDLIVEAVLREGAAAPA